MNSSVKKCFLAGLTALLLLPAGCRQSEIIPSRDMETLFAEFYLADACIESANDSHAETYLNPDSLHVYRPILEKYGYTDTVFQQSMSYYLHHPKDLSAIFKRVRIRLEKAADQPLDRFGDDAADGVISEEEEVTEEEVELHEGSEPAIEKEPGDVRPAKKPEKIEKADRVEEKKPAPKPEPRPQRKESKRKRMSKDDLKRLEEELKK